jgi:mRNA interferase MazF
MCPITRQMKGYPFEVHLPADLHLEGVVLADQVKNLDWRARQAARIGAVPKETVAQVVGLLQTYSEEPANQSG